MLTLFLCDLLCNLTLKTFRGGASFKNTLYNVQCTFYVHCLPTLTTDLIWALKPWGAFSSPLTAGLESSQCWSTQHSVVCDWLVERKKPGRVQTTASSRVGAQNEGQDISSSKALRAPEKQTWYKEVCRDNQDMHTFANLSRIWGSTFLVVRRPNTTLVDKCVDSWCVII